MCFLLFGTGQLAQALLSIDGNVCGSIIPLSRDCYPVCDTQAFEAKVQQYGLPAVIINAAAYTDVEQAERDPVTAMAVNYHAVAALAYWAKQHNTLLVHFSTDYVFDGCGEAPWREDDHPGPLNVYGQSKWLGEQAIVASGCRYLIIRTSWLHSPWRHNFLKTMLHLGQSHDELSVVCDQIGAPTSASMLAEVTLYAVKRILAEPALAGLYHVTATGNVSWYDYARFIFSEANVLGLIGNEPHVKPITSQEYPGIARRPLTSILDTQQFQQTFDLVLPDWQQGVRLTLQALLKEQQ